MSLITQPQLYIPDGTYLNSLAPGEQDLPIPESSVSVEANISHRESNVVFYVFSIR